ASGAGIVQQLLSFARKKPQTPRRIELRRYLKETLPLFKRTAGESIHLRLDPPEPEHAIMVDPSQLTAALINLIANARDAMDGKGEVVVGAQSTQASITVFVTDEGRGITTEDQARIFEPFFTTKGPEKGSGIGLSMVYGFVRESGGTVNVESNSGKGTTISLTFPTHSGSNREL
ncbi:MAG: ATP-binding protein, partial [Myxococcota bacterium]